MAKANANQSERKPTSLPNHKLFLASCFGPPCFTAAACCCPALPFPPSPSRCFLALVPFFGPCGSCSPIRYRMECFSRGGLGAADPKTGGARTRRTHTRFASPPPVPQVTFHSFVPAVASSSNLLHTTRKTNKLLPAPLAPRPPIDLKHMLLACAPRTVRIA